jgi:hypothetical protein
MMNRTIAPLAHFPVRRTSNRVSKESASLLVERYSVGDKMKWDRFVKGGKNATFLHLRDYMDYHADRFTDFSLMIYRGRELAGVMPANLEDDGTLVSHQGLTYGGLVVPRCATLQDVLASFHAGLRYLNQHEIPRLVYKRIPSFFNTLPDDDVLYALFLLQARLIRRDCAQVIFLADKLPPRKLHGRQVKKAIRSGLRLGQEVDFVPFWDQVLTPCLLGRHGVSPVHTAGEISLLASRFPEQIKLFSVYCGSEMIAGATIYETPTVAHAQYIAATDDGRDSGALDYLFDSLINDYYKHKRYFDFGICNESEGHLLNHGLLQWKQGFGARTCAHDFYEIPTESYAELESMLRSEPQSNPGRSANGHNGVLKIRPAVLEKRLRQPNGVGDAGYSIGEGTRIEESADVDANRLPGRLLGDLLQIQPADTPFGTDDALR